MRLQAIVPGIERVRGMIVSNVFVVKTSRSRFLLIDSGYVAERMTLLRGLARAGIGPERIDGVLLTHRHSDHAGNASWFQRHGVPIICHRSDADVLARRASSPKLRRRGLTPHAIVAGALAEYENRFAVRLEADRAVDDGDEVFGLEVKWMPGHTEGSAFFVHAPTRALFSGDTLLAALPPLVMLGGLSLPYATFCVDYEGALESLRRFFEARLEYDVLCAGHGRPVTDRASRKVEDFLHKRLIEGRRTLIDRLAALLGSP